MARKTEKWVEQRLPDPRKLSEALVKLSEREIAVVSCAFLDAILADLVASSLRADPAEVEEFVGLNGDGRAPLASFGARIQAAYLLGLIDKPSRDILRHLKSVRNLFSHNVAISFADQRVAKSMRAVCQIYHDNPPRPRKNRQYTSSEAFASQMENHGFSPDACSGIFVGAATVEMKRMHESCRRRLSRRRTEKK